MSIPSVIQGDVAVAGTLSANLFDPPAGCITDAAIAGSGASGVQASKLICHHRYPVELFAASTAVTALASRYVFTAKAAGSLLTLQAVITGAVATGSDRTITIDLQKSTGGGAFATVLSSTIGFTHTSTLLTPASAVFASQSYVAGDTFQLVVTVAGSAGAQATGLGIELSTQEQYI